jgi:hypothetical protein
VRRSAVAAAAAILWAGCGDSGTPEKPKSLPPPAANPAASVDISQIMVAYEPVKPRSQDEAFKKAVNLIQRVRNGERFENLIVEATDDLNEAGKPFNDGSYTISLRGGRTDPVLVKYVLRLKAGEVGEPPYDSGQAILVVRRDR